MVVNPNGGQITSDARPVRASKGQILPMHPKSCSARRAGEIRPTSKAQFIILFLPT
jgi:hypothetical protein